MKKLVLLSLVLAATALAKDFFPLAIGDAWNFTFDSRTAQVIPESPVTLDSGTVRWEVLYGEGSSVCKIMHVLEKRGLVRHRQMLNGQTVYDSLFSPPRITLDTIVFREGVAPFDTGRVRDSIINAVSFSTATCPIAIHDPSKPVSADLGIKDTVIGYNGSSLDCIATTPSICGNLATTAWSFILADSIGPVKIVIFPGAPGADYYENRYLLSREYNVSVKHRVMAVKWNNGFTVTFNAGHIRLIRPRGQTTPVSGVLYNASGRMVRTFPEKSEVSITWEIKNVPHGMYLLHCKTASGSFSRPLFLRE
jgi:hypothetical protein